MDLEGALLHRGDGVGHAQSAIVVGMDADLRFREASSYRADYRGDFGGKTTPIGVAEDEVFGSSLHGRFESAECVIGIGGVAVKKVFGIVDDLATFLFEKGDGVGDHTEIFCWGGTENFFDMEEPAFAEDGDHGGFRLQKKTDLGVSGGVDVGTTGGAEGSELAASPVELLGFGKEFTIFVVGAGPTAFDIVKAVRGESFGKAKFIGEGKVNALALSPITQGGVVDGEMGDSGHGEKG